MKKILLLSTGGTIASTPGENGLTPTMTGQFMVELIPDLEGLCEIHCKELLSLDSSNMQPEDWAVIAKAVFAAVEVFDGVVITHGTDTMGYTAAALSFMLQNLNKPVVLTGSQLSIGDPNTDGKRNILDAFRTAADGRLKGVYLVFDHTIIRGVNARKVCSRNFHAFESLNRPAEGVIRNGEVCLSAAPSPTPQNTLSLNTNFDSDVLLLRVYPGMDPKLLESVPGLGYRAVVLEAFGLGGIPDVRRNLLPAITALIEQKIPVIVTTQCVQDGSDMSVYDVGVFAERAGALCAGNMITEAIMTKLMWILGQTDDYDTILSMFKKDLVGEFNL